MRSKNVPTVRLAQDVGTRAVAELAEEAGIDPPISEQPSMALGTVAVSPLELAAAYTAFAAPRRGRAPALRPARRAPKTAACCGRRTSRSAERVLDPGVAYVVTDALQDVLTRGTGTAVREAGFRAPAAGKTGTTNDGADAWFVGYTPESWPRSGSASTSSGRSWPRPRAAAWPRRCGRAS